MTERSDAGGGSLDQAVAALAACPHLVSVDGPWHAATPSRAHRCRVLAEGRPTLERQQLHCLGPTHVDCPTWLEWNGARPAQGRRGPFVETAPIVLEGPGLGLSVSAARRRLTTPVSLVIVAAAVGALMLARGPLAPGSSGAGDDRPAATPSTSATLATAVPAGATATPRTTARPTAGATATPAPAATARPTTYRVRRGDTLSAIAARFKTTVAEIAALNGITNPSLIRVGQVLKLP